MPFERFRKILGKERILHWDRELHPGIVWRFPDPSSKNETERDPNKIDAFQVKIGERAVALINNEFYEDTPPGVYWLKGEQKKGLEVIYVDQGQTKQQWGYPGTILTKDNQPLGAHGFYIFRTVDPRSFVLSIVSAQRKYTEEVPPDQRRDTDEGVNAFIKSSVADILRQHLTNYTVLDGQVLREREAFTLAMKAKCQELFSRWGLELIDIGVELYIRPELMDTINRKAEVERYTVEKTIEERKLELDKKLALLHIGSDKDVHLASRQFEIIQRESAQILKTMELDVLKLEGEMVKLATEIKAGRHERIAQAEAVANELRQRAEASGELLRKTTETELKLKETEAENKVKTGIAEIDAWKEVEKARAEAQQRVMLEENKLKTLKEVNETLAKMAEAVALGGAEGEAMRKGLEQKFVELLHQIGIDVPEYEKAKALGRMPPTEIKIEKKVTKEEDRTKTCPKCGRKLAADASFCDKCGTQIMSIP